jgi:hypothetical protein
VAKWVCICTYTRISVFVSSPRYYADVSGSMAVWLWLGWGRGQEERVRFPAELAAYGGWMLELLERENGGI